MRHTIKALRLITVVLWIAVLLLPVTVALSLFEMFEARDSVRIGKPSFSVLNGNFSISVPFSMNNTGFYDISELCVNICIYDGNEKIAELSTQPLNIPAGEMTVSNLNTSVRLTDIFSKNSELLTNNKDLDVSITLHFRVAYVLAFDVAGNFPIQWGAPFSDLNITYIGGNDTYKFFSISFYNNASFPLSEQLKVELYNFQNVSIGSVKQFLNVASNGFCQESFEIKVSEAAKEGIIIRLFFADILIYEKRWGSP